MIIDFKKDYVSTNFKWSETTVTSTGIKNEPTNPEILMNIKMTATKIETVRLLLGESGIIVNSWYRSEKVNAAVSGSKTSQHMTGCAVDIRSTKMSAKAVYEKLGSEASKNILMYDQLIYYPASNFCHIGWKLNGEKNRLQVFTK
ncbi:MAG: D-Ala-D-Ala carboxypeptidase family metallohydrolase [Fusobacteriaceae bacterium]